MTNAARKEIDDRYTSGEYLEKNPTFHVERADFKASNVRKMLDKHHPAIESVCDLGCGAGEVLKLLASEPPIGKSFVGYELSPQGYAMACERSGPNLSFRNTNLFETTDRYDLLISLDVFEHVEDYLGFLRNARKHAKYFLYHIPLDMNAQAVLRGKPISHVRKKLGHLHYFSKESALASLTRYGLHDPRSLLYPRLSA